jgi:uncharacterized protein
MRVLWDEAKAKRNPIAHDGVTFDETRTILFDPYALTREDDDSTGEHRFVTLGCSDKNRCLIVVWAQPQEDEIRIISAWKATAQQRKRYEQQFA